MTKLLSDFTVGEGGKIISVTGEGRVRRRLFDMGVTPGAELIMRKKAPLGDPIEITIRVTSLLSAKQKHLAWRLKLNENLCACREPQLR